MDDDTILDAETLRNIIERKRRESEGKKPKLKDRNREAKQLKQLIARLKRQRQA